MTRAGWLLLLVLPGGLVAAPVLWVALVLRDAVARRRRPRFIGEPLRPVDLTGLRRAPASLEDRS